jgi:hypothetical protein
MKKTRSKIEYPPRIVKVSPHTYIICGGGYRTMRDILAFNKRIKIIDDNIPNCSYCDYTPCRCSKEKKDGR